MPTLGINNEWTLVPDIVYCILLIIDNDFIGFLYSVSYLHSFLELGKRYVELYQHYQKVSLELRKSNDRLYAERQLRHVNDHIFQNVFQKAIRIILLLSNIIAMVTQAPP